MYFITWRWIEKLTITLLLCPIHSFLFQKFSAASLSDNSSSGHYIHSHSLSALSSCAGNDNRADDIGNDVDSDTQPKVSQYINPNCVLLSYFSGDTSTVVDEHFSRALSQPSSFNLDKSTGLSFSKMKSGKLAILQLSGKSQGQNHFRDIASFL